MVSRFLARITLDIFVNLRLVELGLKMRFGLQSGMDRGLISTWLHGFFWLKRHLCNLQKNTILSVFMPRAVQYKRPHRESAIQACDGSICRRSSVAWQPTPGIVYGRPRKRPLDAAPLSAPLRGCANAQLNRSGSGDLEL